MSMPKGFKSEHGYATVTNYCHGMDYRRIAEKMSADGLIMNHATARNIFLRAMKKMAISLCDLYEVKHEVNIEKTVRDPRFQEAMIEIVSNACVELKRGKETTREKE